MKTRVLLFLLFTITVFAIGTLVTVLFNTTPSSTGVVALFYTSFFATLFGLIFFSVYGLAYLRLQAIPNWQSTLTALRLGVVGSTLFSVLLAIRSVNLLNLATFIILVILAVAAELVMRKRSIQKVS